MQKQMKPLTLLFSMALLCCPVPGLAVDSCTAATNGVAFGEYNPLSSATVDGNGTIQVDCSSSSAAVSVSLSIPGANANSRYMTSADSQLQYNLYTNTSRTQVWGDGTNGTATIPGSVAIQQGRGTATSYIYGRIFGGQRSAKPGSYSTQFTVTISF